MHMNALYILNDIVTNGFYDESLYIVTNLSILFGLFVIYVKNPIVSVLLLICLFVSTSIYLSLIGNIFLALSYLLVYVGAVSIFILFILMLINVRTSELLNDTKNFMALAIYVCIVFGFNIIYLYNVDNIISKLSKYTSNLPKVANSYNEGYISEFNISEDTISLSNDNNKDLYPSNDSTMKNISESMVSYDIENIIDEIENIYNDNKYSEIINTSIYDTSINDTSEPKVNEETINRFKIYKGSDVFDDQQFNNIYNNTNDFNLEIRESANNTVDGYNTSYDVKGDNTSYNVLSDNANYSDKNFIIIESKINSDNISFANSNS